MNSHKMLMNSEKRLENGESVLSYPLPSAHLQAGIEPCVWMCRSCLKPLHWMGSYQERPPFPDCSLKVLLHLLNRLKASSNSQHLSARSMTHRMLLNFFGDCFQADSGMRDKRRCVSNFCKCRYMNGSSNETQMYSLLQQGKLRHLETEDFCCAFGRTVTLNESWAFGFCEGIQCV